MLLSLLPSRRVLIGSAAVLVLAVFGGVLLFWPRPEQPPPPPAIVFPVLTIQKTGLGTVTSDPTGIQCGTHCAARFAQGTNVTLTDNPAVGQELDVSNTDCVSGSLQMSGDVTCHVAFKAIDYPTTTVKRYSTLYGIAHRLCNGDGSRWTEIQALNENVDPHTLQYGQELKLPLNCTSDLPSLPIDTERYYTVGSVEVPATETKTASVTSTSSSSVASSQLEQSSQITATMDHCQTVASVDKVSDHVSSFVGFDLGSVQIVTIASLPVSGYVAAFAPHVPTMIVEGAPFAVHWYETTG